jgi:hypothetical protein
LAFFVLGSLIIIKVYKCSKNCNIFDDSNVSSLGIIETKKGGGTMRKRKLSFKELVMENKQEIKSDFKALERIEAKIDDKHSKKVVFS